MGQAKHQMMEEEARGWSEPPEKSVCVKHFDDNGLKKFITKNGIMGVCDYCGRKTKVIALNPFLEFVNNRIREYYGLVEDQNLYLESFLMGDEDDHIARRVAGYTFPSHREDYEFADLAYEVGLYSDNGNLDNDIYGCFPDGPWCIIDPFNSTEGEELIYSWKHFCEVVKYSQRYTFFMRPEFSAPFERSENGLDDILSELGRCVVDAKLIKALPAGTTIYRGQVHPPTETINTFSRLASPPNEKANQNRMSPAGVSMFYGAFDSATVEAEIYTAEDKAEGKIVTTGEFATSQPLRLVDFTEIPRISFFSSYNLHGLEFLHSFSVSIAQPYPRDNIVNIEYAPTQIMTEYFRYIFTIGNQHIHGLIYNSTKHPSGKCCVLFFNHEECPAYLSLEYISR